MLSIGKVKDAAAARSYFEKDNYYLTDQSDREWQGAGARALSLTCDIQPEQFEQMLNGTINDEQFIRQREVLAADLTFSAPKSLSIIGIKDTRVIEAHRQAVEQTLKMLEAEFTVTRKGAGGTEQVQTDNLIIAKFHHTTSREQDPQTHTHCVIMNATQGDDGKWRTLDLREIYKNKMYLGQMYRSYLAHNLKEIGYQIEAKQKGLFEIKGVDQELMDTLSKRRQQVISRKEDLRAQFPHLGDAELSAMATLDTRRAKDKEITGAELVNRWEAEAAQAGYDLHTVWDKTLNQTRSHEFGKYEAIKKVVEVLSENEGLLTKEQILKGAMELSYTSSPAELERALNYLAATEGEIVRLDNRTFTTRELEAAELEILELASEAKDNGDTICHNYDGAGYTHLSTGQADGSRKILTTKDDLILIQGYAGVGKTTGMLPVVKKEAEAAGWTVRGAAFTAIAAGGLQEVGIPAQTIHSFLLEEHAYNKKQLLIIDEASMIGTKQTLELLELVKKTGNKIVFMGDTAQLQAISAGRSFRMLQERSGLETVEIKEIKRQRTEEYKELVNKVIEKDTGAVIAELEKKGNLIETKHMRLALDKAAEEYSSDTLILANSNRERRELNKLIRGDLQKNNLVGQEDQQYRIREDARFDGIEKNKAVNYQVGNIIQFSKAVPGVPSGAEGIVSGIDTERNVIKALMDNKGKLETREIDLSKYGDRLNVYRHADIKLAQGDKVLFTKNDKDLKIDNNTEATVLSVGQDTLKVQIKDRELEINTKEYPYIDHGYAMTVHKSQGKSVEKVVVLANTQTENTYNSFYVGVTRGKQELKIITDDITRFKDQIKNEDRKLNIVEHRQQNYTLGR